MLSWLRGRRLQWLVLPLTLLLAPGGLALSISYRNAVWPSATGLPRSVHPLVFDNLGGRPTRFHLYDLGPAERDTARIAFVDWHINDYQYQLPAGAALVATDARVLWRGKRPLIELVPWAGRSLPARRHFVVVDGSSPERQFVGAFETGDSFEETAPVLTGLEVREIIPQNRGGCAGCSDSGRVVVSELPAREYPRLMAIWPETRPDGAPESFFESRGYGIGQVDGGPPGPIDLYLHGGREYRLLVRERRMNGAFGPAVHVQFTIPEGSAKKSN